MNGCRPKAAKDDLEAELMAETGFPWPLRRVQDVRSAHMYSYTWKEEKKMNIQTFAPGKEIEIGRAHV